MRRIAAAVAAISLVAGAAHAQGQGQGRGNDRGGPSAEKGQQGGNGGGRDHAEHGNRGQADGPSMAQSMRGSDNRGSEDRGGGNAMREQRGNNANAGRDNNADANRGNNADRGNRDGNQRAERAVERGNADNRGRGNDDRAVVIDRRIDRDVDIVRVRNFGNVSARGLIDGCPPGLAKKRNGCRPPGQARNDPRRALWWDRPDFWGLSRLGDGRYFYDDGYLVRYAPSGILGYVPLLGGALSIGNAWPSYYEPFEMPGYYERYYGLGPYNSYRYADDVIYRVDPETAAITSVAALLTGDDFAIGQPMPLGYDVYNVPYGYRDRYLDGPDAYYRYSDGYIYQVDPETQLIAAAIELLAS